MSQKIDPREVLTYLNELGYVNINAQQLKDFITDLKKLIKYESRVTQKQTIETITLTNSNKSNFVPHPYVQANINEEQSISVHTEKGEIDYSDRPFCHCNHANTEQDKKEQDDVFSHLHSQHTVASRAKDAPKKQKQISVHIKKPKAKPEVYCTHLEKENEDDDKEKGNLHVIQNIETISNGSKLYINTESTIRSTKPASRPSTTTKPSPSKKKSKCSFIRSSSAKSINKCDPVALYHYYQGQWKKQKIPGQENHSDLRWSVREKMLGGPKVQICPSAPILRRRCNSWKG